MLAQRSLVLPSLIGRAIGPTRATPCVKSGVCALDPHDCSQAAANGY